jgi:hypothetical protein
MTLAEARKFGFQLTRSRHEHDLACKLAFIFGKVRFGIDVQINDLGCNRALCRG